MASLRRFLVILPLLLLGLSACSSSGGHTSQSTSTTPTGSTKPTADTIVIKNFSFHPGTLTVAPGATVTVHNEDQATHTVTATGKAFDTGDVPGGATKSFTAPTKPGQYPYICQIHQYMTATLVVK